MTIFFCREPGAFNFIYPVYQNYKSLKLFVAKDYVRTDCERLNLSYVDFNQIADRRIGPGDSELIEKWLTALGSVQLIVTGTSTYDDFTDRLIWTQAQRKGITTVAIIDQWVRPTERFVYGEQRYVPDYAIVPGEEIGEELTSEGLVRKGFLLSSNPFLSELFENRNNILQNRDKVRNEINRFFGKKAAHILVYASEPQRIRAKMGTLWKDTKFDELEVFHLIKDALAESKLPDSLLIVKLHPKENYAEYEGQGANIVKDEFGKHDLIAAADLIIGVSSVFLIESVILGKRVLSVDLWNNEREQLITNQLGLSTKVSDRQELAGNLSGYESLPVPGEAEIRAKLGLQAGAAAVIAEKLQQLAESKA